MSWRVDDREVMRMFRALGDKQAQRKLADSSLSAGALYLQARVQKQIRDYPHVIKYARGPKSNRVGPGPVRGFVDTGFLINSVTVAGPGDKHIQKPIVPVTRKKKGQKLLPPVAGLSDREAVVSVDAEYGYYLHKRWPFFKEVIEAEAMKALDVVRKTLVERLKRVT